MKTFRTLVALAFVSTAVVSQAGVDPQAAFDSLKKLTGTWAGSGGMGGPPSDLEVLYKVTAGGSVVMETLFAGSDHEMISMYHMDSGKMVMTHYCAAGNQPHLVLDAKASTPERMVFKFAGGSNMNPKKDMHIHEGWIELAGGNNLNAQWTGFIEGKAAHVAEFKLARKEI